MQSLKVGKYEFVEFLGRGGSAEVYRVRMNGARGFAKQFAIKRILAGYQSDPEVARKFADEARLNSFLDHPNIVQVFDFFVSEELYLLVMEFIHGKDLSRILQAASRRNEPLPLEFAIYVMNEVCKGLDYAHRKCEPETGRPLHIIHRDITPRNVMISFYGAVKIVDFGIAKAKFTKTTKTGRTAGTLGYMSPEQFRAEKVDHRSDIFSAGVVLWELVTGSRLFDGESDSEVLRKIEACHVPNPMEVNPRVPGALAGILLKALARRPDDRYEHMSEMQEELQRLLTLLAPSYREKEVVALITGLFDEKTPKPVSIGLEFMSLTSSELSAMCDGLKQLEARLFDIEAEELPSEAILEPAPAIEPAKFPRPSLKAAILGIIAVGVIVGGSLLGVRGSFRGLASLSAEEPVLDFGGIHGYVHGAKVAIPPGLTSCPSGYSSYHVFGTYKVDYPLIYCAKPHEAGSPAPLLFGGMYGQISGKPTVNPATGKSSCPSGFNEDQILGTGSQDSPVWLCWALPSSGARTNLLFGGIVGFVDTKFVANPLTKEGPPAGYKRYPLLDTSTVDWPLMFDAKLLSE